MAKQLLRQTETLEVWKVYGTNSTDTIALATDCLMSTMAISGTPTVNILGLTWYLTPGASDKITVTRNSVEVLNLHQNGQMDFAGNGGFSDTTQNTSDIVIAITGTGGCYVTLRKAAGYANKKEPWAFGPYDNTGAVGS